MWSSIDSSIAAWSTENYDFRISRSKIWPRLLYLFRFSFLTILNIYKFLRVFIQGYIDQETYFLCVKLLRLYAIGFCNWVLPNIHCWCSEEFCSQQHLFKLLELVMYLGSVQRVNHKLEVCASNERRLLQDQVQLSIGAKVQL